MLKSKKILYLVAVCLGAISVTPILLRHLNIFLIQGGIVTINKPLLEKEVEHPNGLTINVPDGFFVKFQTDVGFYLIPLNAKPRYASGLSATLVNNESKPDLKPQGFQIINGEKIYYNIQDVTAGSGGREVHFNAWKIYRNSYIYVEQAYQEEDSISNSTFKAGWNLIASAKIKNIK